MGVKNFSTWNVRRQDKMAQVEPFRKYFFVCEGANTERWYFQRLIVNKMELNIHPLIGVCFLEKTGEDKDITYPKHLIDFAEKQKLREEVSFDLAHDKMVIVFDADIFERKGKTVEYTALIQDAEGKGNILGVTNPSFELFLLLHFDKSVEKIIKPNQSRILQNKKEGTNTPVYWLLHKNTGINCKRNSIIGELADQIDTAIVQEKHLNQDIHDCMGKLTSNIGCIIDAIRNDHPESHMEKS